MKTFLALLIAATGAFAQTDNPVATFYSGPEGYPAWTDSIRWGNVYNITNYGGGTNMSGTANFTAFEAARDAAYAAGGGVIYFPAGTYDITLPNAGNGPLSRGLMLRTGTVLRGATPVGDQFARSNATYTADGVLALPTKLRFAKRTRTDQDGITRTIPCDWSFVGLQPQTGQGVKDVGNVGVVWLELDGGTVFFGAQYGWSATWNSSTSFLGATSKTNWPDTTHPWSSRAADGTHPGDSFCGATTSYVGAGVGRLVFGVKLTDAAVVNDFYWAAGRGADGVTSAFSIYRFCGRIAAYGSNILIANNVLPMSTNNFIYRQWTVDASNAKATRDVLWDYANLIGIDVNKSLSGIPKPTTPGTGYYGSNVVVRDNWIFNRGNKGVDLSGQGVVLQNNLNQRYYLGYTMPPAPYPNPGSTITTVLDGFHVQTSGESASDYLSRGYDLGGRNLWVDHCEVYNTGSTGNDGEGVMSQRHNNIDVYSWAFTDCRQATTNLGAGTIGELGWIGSWGQNIYGFLLLRNVNDNFVGEAGPGDWYLLDMTCALNKNNSGGAATISSNYTGVYLPKDFTATAPSNAVTAPSGLTTTVLADRTGIQLDWTDNSTNELGFRIERRINGGVWRTVAYRPAINLSKTVAGTEAFSTTAINQLNNPRWIDYLAAAGKTNEYRVFAINAADNSSFGSAIATPLVLPVLSYTAWSAGFPGIDTSPTANPSGDGIPNLLKYALNLNPALPSLLPGPVPVNDHLTLTYLRRDAPTDISYRVEVASDVTGVWTNAGVTEQILADDGTFQSIKATDPATISGNAKRFLHLKVTYP